MAPAARGRQLLASRWHCRTFAGTGYIVPFSRVSFNCPWPLIDTGKPQSRRPGLLLGLFEQATTGFGPVVHASRVVFISVL